MLDDDYFYRLSKDLLERTEELTLTLLRRVRDTAKRIIRDPRANINLSKEERAILQLWKDYNQDARAWVNDTMPKAYKKGLVTLDGEQLVEGRFSAQPLFGDIFAGEISDRAKELLKDNAEHWNMYGVFEQAAYSDFNDTQLPVVRSATDKLRELAIEASDSAYRNADTLTRRDLTQELMTRFADEGITGVRYADGRTMNLQSYSEMIARSQTGNASRQAHLNRMQEYGKDLVVISTHYPCSNLCIDQQGNVYSISGRSNVYPPLRQAISNGLYHANCYDKETEVLTIDGWKLFKNVTKEDLILSLNPETCQKEWVEIDLFHSYNFEGKLIHFYDEKQMDLRVTPGHMVYVWLGDPDQPYQLIEAQKVKDIEHTHITERDPALHTKPEVKEIEYNDMVYCLTLEKNHIMWVRRNGKTTWSGNCKHSQSAYTHGQSKPETRDIDKRRNREMYNAQQRQREIERRIRHYKRRKATAVDPQAEQKAQDYISKWQRKQREHIDDNPFLRRRYSGESV